MKQNITIALAGNPNSGKTTLFNALTGSNQYVGNWPGVTVEKKEGKLKGREGVTVTDLPGVYSLSPYTMEEVVARNYLVHEQPDVILNMVDGSNLERNLYLTTQLIELGIPVVVAINMMDVVRKNGDNIDIAVLSQRLGCKIVEISALKGDGIEQAAQLAIEQAEGGRTVPLHSFSGEVEHALAHIEEAVLHDLPAEQQRWYAIKLFERDEKVRAELAVAPETLQHIEQDIQYAEAVLDDISEGIIANERYVYLSRILQGCYHKKNQGGLSLSDKIDRILTHRVFALPIFALVMTLVYYISVSSVGAVATDWANDGVFGEGWHLFGIGAGQYEQAMDEYAAEHIFTDAVQQQIAAAAKQGIAGASALQQAVEDGSFADFDEQYQLYGAALSEAGFALSNAVEPALESEAVPAAEDYGIWVRSVPDVLGGLMDSLSVSPWLHSLVLDGIVAGVGAVLGFVPQMLVLFFFLAFLEGCGYMSRIAFVMDQIFRRFGLSGKSFIPLLVGTGCSVPGIMASRTIESESDRRMTIMTTSFIPCGAKVPVIVMIATALFGGAWWVVPSAYLLGLAAIAVSGIILKKTRAFAGEPAPFVMELPAYHLPTAENLLRNTWERGWSFIKKAGTVILLASVVIWAGSSFGWADGVFVGFAPEQITLENSILGVIGSSIAWVFAPLGFDNIQASIASIMGLIAKEEIVGVFGVLDFEGLGQLSAYSFLVFNLLNAPCFAAIGAIRREMNNAKWTLFAIGYQTTLAYLTALMIYQFGMAISGQVQPVGLAFALLALALTLYLLFRKPSTGKPQLKTV